LWIGGDEVLAVIETDKMQLARLSDCRSLRFRSITMGSDSVLWGGYGTMPKTLPKLNSDERNLHFYYALDFAPLSGKTQYRYRLNNSQWSTWTEKQDVEFLNLPSGSYNLSVQARLANGELSDVTSIEFSIAYPLLMRWYMYLIYVVILAYIVWLLFRYRLKRLQRDKIKLEQIVEERTADLRNAQHELIRQEKMASVGKLTEGLIDRILNPMNYIINFSKMSNDLLRDLKENIDNNKEHIDSDDYEDTLDVLDMLTENLQNVDKYGQNTTRTLKAMEEMLKDRTGGYVDMDLLPVLRQDEKMLANYYAKEIEQYHIHISFYLPDGAMPLHGNPDMLSKTMMSLLGNAVYAVVKKAQKQQQYNPEISLTATVTDGQYILKVRDNGVGIEEKILGKIFDPFFTTKTTEEAAGVGLYLSREIIQNHGGDMSAVSTKDEFTEFTITLSNNQTI
jgi:signal transduction histidine kinase